MPKVMSVLSPNALGVVADSTLLAAVASRRHKIHALVVSASGATTVKVTEGDDAADARLLHEFLPANGRAVLPVPYELPLNTALKITNSANTVAVVVYYTTEAP
jgi:hypothetical protein